MLVNLIPYKSRLNKMFPSSLGPSPPHPPFLFLTYFKEIYPYGKKSIVTKASLFLIQN